MPWGSPVALCAPVAGLIVLVLVSCGCAGTGDDDSCRDADNDGYGVGCAQGPDCDDADPSRFAICVDAGPLPDCEADALATHCPCVRGDRQLCFAAAAESIGVGPCKAGRVVCVDGEWSVCEDVVLPQAEVCNGVDDDCDGSNDEGVESPCGGCNADCKGGVWGTAAAPFDVSAPLAVSAAGELTLQWHAHAALNLWVPNSDEGSVSKLDAHEAREVARYRTRGAYPTRVAVDHRGDAWVLDSAFGGAPYVSKFAAEITRCRAATPSSTGSADVLAAGADGCLILDAALSRSSDPRSLSVDGALAPDSDRAGDVWIGLAGTHELLQLDGNSGLELARYGLDDFVPYASTFDARGMLWLIDRAGYLLRFDPAATSEPKRWSVPFACYTLEALSSDMSGRLFLSGFGCERVFSYDAPRDLWRELEVPRLESARGIIALDDDFSWVVYESGRIARLQRDPLSLAAAQSLAADVFVPYESVALSADGEGQIWAVSSQGGPEGVGLATRFDPQLGVVSAQVPVGKGPRGGGDLSGYASGGEYAPFGTVTHVFGGCGLEARNSDGAQVQAITVWQRLRIVAEMGAHASVRVWIRHAAQLAELTDAAFVQLAELPLDGAVFPLTLDAGGVLEVKLDLSSPQAIGAPRVARVGIEWECPGPD